MTAAEVLNGMNPSNPKETWKNDFYITRGSTKGADPPNDATKGVDLKGRTITSEVMGSHKHYLKDKGKAILPSEQLTTTSFKQELEDIVDSIFKTRNQYESVIATYRVLNNSIEYHIR